MSSHPFSPACWTIPVARWSSWTESDAHAPVPLPPLDFVEPALRRRLSRLAKVVLGLAHACAADESDLRFVFASRHGDLSRTVSLLSQLAAREELSPTAFSMSVLNACPGLYSILCKNTAASTAISASTETFFHGLLEAAMQYANKPDQPVLLVYADDAIPEVYRGLVEREEAGQACALLLKGDAATHWRWTLNAMSGTASAASACAAFIQSLSTGKGGNWSNGTRQWQWEIAP